MPNQDNQSVSNNPSGTKTWLLLIVAISILCGFNIKEKWQLEAKLMEAAQKTGEIGLGEFQASRRLALAQAGRFLKWPDHVPVGEDPGYRVVLAIDEQSCGTCRDSETRFITDLAAEIGDDRVKIIVHAQSERYIRAYQQVNAVTLPVIQDRSGYFFKQNRIMQTPMTLLVNDRDEVIAAHFPTPGKPQMSEPFHEMLLKTFGVVENKPERRGQP